MISYVHALLLEDLVPERLAILRNRFTTRTSRAFWSRQGYPLASYPVPFRGEGPGIHCLRMRQICT